MPPSHGEGRTSPAHGHLVQSQDQATFPPGKTILGWSDRTPRARQGSGSRCAPPCLPTNGAGPQQGGWWPGVPRPQVTRESCTPQKCRHVVHVVTPGTRDNAQLPHHAHCALTSNRPDLCAEHHPVPGLCHQAAAHLTHTELFYPHLTEGAAVWYSSCRTWKPSSPSPGCTKGPGWVGVQGWSPPAIPDPAGTAASVLPDLCRKPSGWVSRAGPLPPSPTLPALQPLCSRTCAESLPGRTVRQAEVGHSSRAAGAGRTSPRGELGWGALPRGSPLLCSSHAVRQHLSSSPLFCSNERIWGNQKKIRFIFSKLE